jgi:hypothetical protein
MGFLSQSREPFLLLSETLSQPLLQFSATRSEKVLSIFSHIYWSEQGKTQKNHSLFLSFAVSDFTEKHGKLKKNSASSSFTVQYRKTRKTLLLPLFSLGLQ